MGRTELEGKDLLHVTEFYKITTGPEEVPPASCEPPAVECHQPG